MTPHKLGAVAASVRIHKLRAAACCVCLLATFMAIPLFWATGTSVAVVPLAGFTGVVLILAGLHVTYTSWRPDPIIGPITGGLVVVTWTGLVAAMAALAALRTGAPLIDVSLARADATLGLYTPTLVGLAARHAVFASILKVAYISSVPMVFAALILLGIKRRLENMWELCLVFAVTGPLCSYLVAIAPATAAFTFYGIPPDILSLLPTGAGRFFLPILEAYHSRTANIVDVRNLEGVVTFPSFHAVMALLTAYSLRGLRVMSVLAWTWCGIVLISTIPIGGHYVIDIIGGALVWASVTSLIHVSMSVRPRTQPMPRGDPDPVGATP